MLETKFISDRGAGAGATSRQERANPMRIDAVTVEACRLPPAVPWEDATNKVQGLELIFVELRTTAGSSAPASAIPSMSAHRDPRAGRGLSGRAGHRHGPARLRTDLAADVPPVPPARPGVNSMAMAAIDIAVWDLIGKHHGQPLYRLIGGARDRIEAYISEINLGAGDTVADLVRRVDDYLAAATARLR